MPKSGVFCHRWNNHGHTFKNIGMAKESEPARRTGWGKNNGSYTRSRWRRKTRGKNCTGIYSANNKVSARTRRTLRYYYEHLLFTFFSQNMNRVAIHRYLAIMKLEIKTYVFLRGMIITFVSGYYFCYWKVLFSYNLSVIQRFFPMLLSFEEWLFGILLFALLSQIIMNTWGKLSVNRNIGLIG